MLNKHPGAQLLKTMGDPPPDIRFGNDQYIQCTAVSPEPSRDLPIFTNPDVPPQVRAYYEHRYNFLSPIRIRMIYLCYFSAINLFSYSRPLPKIGPDGTEEIWTEKTYLSTEEAFPTVLRRSDIVEVQIVDISPVQTALQEVQQRTRQLAGLSLRYSALAKTAQSVSTNPLAMSLNDAVDTPSIGVYRQAFLSGEYVSRYPERAEQVEKLRDAIDDQVSNMYSLFCRITNRLVGSCYRQLSPPTWPTLSTGDAHIPWHYGEIFPQELCRRNTAIGYGWYTRFTVIRTDIAGEQAVSRITPKLVSVFQFLIRASFLFTCLQTPTTWRGAFARGQCHGITSIIPTLSTRKRYASWRSKLL